MINLEQERLEAWVAAKTGLPPPSQAHYVGMEYGESIVVALMYWHFEYEQGELVDVEVSLFVERSQSFTRSVMAVMLYYPFVILGAERLTARIDVENERSIKIADWVGFTKEGRIRRGRFNDHWILGITRGEYEFHR